MTFKTYRTGSTNIAPSCVPANNRPSETASASMDRSFLTLWNKAGVDKVPVFGVLAAIAGVKLVSEFGESSRLSAIAIAIALKVFTGQILRHKSHSSRAVNRSLESCFSDAPP